MTKKTPLYDWHIEHGAKCISFNGWDMPVQYASIVQEHQAVREAAGLFDVSHMGEIIVEGSDALSLLQRIMTNDLSKLHVGRAIYTLMVNDEGGTIDDLLVYQTDENRFMLVVNAGNIDTDYEWIQNHANGYHVDVRNISDEIALLALQGPSAVGILESIADEPLKDEVKPFRFVWGDIGGARVLMSRTGYTGEDGFELYMPASSAIEIANAIFAKGAALCGLGARDTLRLEAALPLYGHELSTMISPLEAALDPFVKLEKEDFVGRDALRGKGTTGIKRRRAGIEMEGKIVPREGYDVYRDGQKIGQVTSGTRAPSLQKSIGMALLNSDYTDIGDQVDVAIRGKLHPARIVALPFYRRKKR